MHQNQLSNGNAMSNSSVKAQEIPEAIDWHEGMLLAPEHFQQMNARQEMLVGYGLSCSPYQWGVRHLEWDANLLASGTLSVTQLEAILPDGLIATVNEPGELELALKPYAEQMRSAAVPVCLVAPARKMETGAGDLERYQSDPGVPPEDASYAGLNGASIPRLRPRLALLTGSIPPKYVGFPLVRVRYENEVFAASNDHPVLSVPVSSRLGSLCSQVARHVREKALYLADRARGSDGGTGQAAAEYVKTLIHSLVSSLPPFEGGLYTGVAHPYPLYLALCAMAGSVAGVGLSLVPPVFPPYDHNNPYESFQEVKKYIFQVIAEGISETWASFRFHRAEQTFVLAAKTGWSEVLGERRPGRTSLVLALRTPSGATEKDMLAWGSNCVIGTSGVVASLVNRRILGAARRPVESADDLIPAKGLLLFELEPDAEFIRLDEDLQVFDRRPDAVPPLEALLFVRKPGK
jgi:type VI secretion system protein ImpJ